MSIKYRDNLRRLKMAGVLLSLQDQSPLDKYSLSGYHSKLGSTALDRRWDAGDNGAAAVRRGKRPLKNERKKVS